MPKNYGVKEKDQVVSHVVNLVLTGKLRSGDRLDRNEIAEQLGLSRIPVQEAVIQLEHDGVLRRTASWVWDMALAGVEVWIVDALRYRPHPSHFSVDDALAWIERIRPGRAILTNLHSDLDYDALSAIKPDLVFVDASNRIKGTRDHVPAQAFETI